MKDKVIKYSKKAKCPKRNCGGMLAYSGTYKRKLPIGFGFAPGQTDFQIDLIAERGYVGECMDCGQKVLAWKWRRHETNKPVNINRKLKAARRGSQMVTA